MKSNVLSSLIWLTLIAISAVLFQVGIGSKNQVIWFSSLFIFIMIYGSLYYIANSYLVYRKFLYFELNPNKNLLLIIFPFFIVFVRNDLCKHDFKYYDFLKFVSFIYPLIFSVVISGIITAAAMLPYAASNSLVFENARGLFTASLISSIILGFGFIILLIVVLIRILGRIKGTKFYRNKRSVPKKIWETIFLFYYFPKFYYEDLAFYKRKRQQTIV